MDSNNETKPDVCLAEVFRQVTRAVQQAQATGENWQIAECVDRLAAECMHYDTATARAVATVAVYARWLPALDDMAMRQTFTAWCLGCQLSDRHCGHGASWLWRCRLGNNGFLPTVRPCPAKGFCVDGLFGVAATDGRYEAETPPPLHLAWADVEREARAAGLPIDPAVIPRIVVDNGEPVEYGTPRWLPRIKELDLPRLTPPWDSYTEPQRQPLPRRGFVFRKPPHEFITREPLLPATTARPLRFEGVSMSGVDLDAAARIDDVTITRQIQRDARDRIEQWFREVGKMTPAEEGRAFNEHTARSSLTMADRMFARERVQLGADLERLIRQNFAPRRIVVVRYWHRNPRANGAAIEDWLTLYEWSWLDDDERGQITGVYAFDPGRAIDLVAQGFRGIRAAAMQTTDMIDALAYAMTAIFNPRQTCPRCGVSWPANAPEFSCTCAPNEVRDHIAAMV